MFLAGRDHWPTYREFQRAGRKSLRDAITRRGGVVRWAEKLGIRYLEHPPGYAPIWTEERIGADLREYLAGREDWPARHEFERDGRTALRNAVNRTGGPDSWATELGLRRKTRRSGIRRGWTPEAVESELRRLIGTGKSWPSRRAFERAGLSSMLTSIYRHEVPAYWASRLGVEQRPAFGGPSKRRWPEELIRSELERFCSGREVWPTEREFIAAGENPLYRAASRNGGVARWADQLGLPRARPSA